MNLCKNDCRFSEPQYEQVLEKHSPSKSLNNNNVTQPPHKTGGSRYTGKIKTLDGIWQELKSAQQDADTSGGVGGSGSSPIVSCLPIMRESSSHLGSKSGGGIRIDCTQLGPIHRKSHQRIISLKNLFSNTPKFQKSFQRGVFLSCLIYSEDKILVTLDDVLPTFQIDEDLSTSFQHDFHWFHKISTVWNDVKFLKQEMEKCDSASTLHFRVKLLQTIVTMQDCLDLRDLGKVFYKPIPTENNNVTFLCTVNHLRSTKLVAAPNLRWIPVEKFKARKAISDTYEVLCNNSQNLMLYHQMSNIPLGKGLYVAYFKLVTSVDLLKLIVPEKTPSIIPHVKIRSNPNVTRAEWELLSFNENEQSKRNLTESQLLLRQQLDAGLKKLFFNLKIDRNSALNHRFYTTEVIEVSSSVTLIVVLPPQDHACLIEGDENEGKWMEDNKLMALPIQIFEMTHMLTYHNTLARRLMRLNSTLEVETVLAQHNRRKAFSSDEMSQSQHQLVTLSSLQSKLEQTWKECRWILEVVKAARAKDRNFMSLREFLSFYSSTSSTPTKKLKSGIPSGSYINGNQMPLNRLQLQHLLHLTKNFHSEGTTIDKLPGPCIPSNPNFKYESSSSLPIAGKASAKNSSSLRTTTSLFDIKVPSNSTQIPELELMKLTLQNDDDEEQPLHYQNIKDIQGQGQNQGQNQGQGQSGGQVGYPEYENLLFNSVKNNTIPSQPLDSYSYSYMRHTSSRSKLVSLPTASNKPMRDPVPGTCDPAGLKTLSWTKQRTSLDRSFNTNLGSTSSSSSRELLSSREELSESEESGGNSGYLKISRTVEIYAAYDCGLCTGSCVRFQINWDTSARQIIHLLVNKLNEEVKSKGGGGLVDEGVDAFCLVSVIGARERVLRMDYKPLRLQKPWDCARLFVRKKNDVTTAVCLEAKVKSNMATGAINI